MSAGPDLPRSKPASEGADPNGTGASGEGAGSALEAMLRKRQMLVNEPLDSSVDPRVLKQRGDAHHVGEGKGETGP